MCVCKTQHFSSSVCLFLTTHSCAVVSAIACFFLFVLICIKIHVRFRIYFPPALNNFIYTVICYITEVSGCIDLIWTLCKRCSFNRFDEIPDSKIGSHVFLMHEKIPEFSFRTPLIVGRNTVEVFIFVFSLSLEEYFNVVFYDSLEHMIRGGV